MTVTEFFALPNHFSYRSVAIVNSPVRAGEIARKCGGIVVHTGNKFVVKAQG